MVVNSHLSANTTANLANLPDSFDALLSLEISWKGTFQPPAKCMASAFNIWAILMISRWGGTKMDSETEIGCSLMEVICQ